MDLMLRAFVEGGQVMYVVAAGAVLVPGAVLIAFLAQLLRWRLAHFLLLVLPVGLAIAGLLGTVRGAMLASEAIVSASPSFIDRIAAQGYALATLPGIWALGVAALGCAGIGLGVASGLLLRPGEKAEWTFGSAVAGVLVGMLMVPAAAWFGGVIAGGTALSMAAAFVFGSLRFPHETQADRARAVSGRILIGAYGMLAFAFALLHVHLLCAMRFHDATQAAPELVSMMQFRAYDGYTEALAVLGLCAITSMITGLLQASSKLGDVDGRSWAQGVVFLLLPLLVVPIAAGAEYTLRDLGAQAVPWMMQRKPVLAAAQLRPPRLDVSLEPIRRAATLQFSEAGTTLDGGEVPPTFDAESVNLEADPDVALFELVQHANSLKASAVCLTVRSHDVLSCLPVRIVPDEASEGASGMLVEAVSPELSMVPQNRGWVLMRDVDTILARGPLEEIAAALPAEETVLRFWVADGRTVEDLVMIRKMLDRESPPTLVWRTDTIPQVPDPSTGDGAMRVDGMDKDAVRAVMVKQTSQFQYCYTRILENRPGIQGAVRLTFTVGPAGTVTSSKTRDSTVNDGEIERCLETRVRNLRFPPPVSGSATVDYPFVFKPTPP